MKKSIYTLAALLVLSASTLTVSAQSFTAGAIGLQQDARGGSDPRPQSFVGTAYLTLLTYFGY